MSEIAVLIPYFNHPDCLEKSLSSISGAEKVDVIIVDDGSSEKPLQRRLKEKYSNIFSVEFITHDINKGLSYALNTGLEYILSKGTYKYVARLDVGDKCTWDRFKKQKSFLDLNPKISLVGSNAKMIDMEGKFLYIRKYPEADADIKKNMYVFSSFMHPTIMFRTNVLEEIGLYPYEVCQDYAFLFKILKRYKAANLKEPLLEYEVNPIGFTYNKYRRLQIDGLKVIWANFKLKYIKYILIGTLKRIVCILLGPKIMMKIGTKLRLIGF
ncbi:MAG: glycosyltransferase [Ignavibacteriales bacterium]|nr:glycosyltransferase [Ignavibacteriales bacterium]